MCVLTDWCELIRFAGPLIGGFLSAAWGLWVNRKEL